MVCTRLLRTLAVLVCLLGPAIHAKEQPVWYQPEQIHLAYGDEPSQMQVTWTTLNSTKDALVQYGISDLSGNTSGIETMFINIDKKLNRTTWIHKATLEGLTPGQIYLYRVGGALGWSELFTFTAMRTDATWGPKLAIYGDMGNDNNQAVPYLQTEAELGKLDAIYHIGDYAYDMNDDAGLIGDAFMKQIQPIAAYVPYMTCPGNHEKAYNFSHYKNRFSMPGTADSMWYSMKLGPARIIMISTEVFYKNEQEEKFISEQYTWLEQELKAANAPSQRAEQPWIMVMGHRPMYCSNDDGPDGPCNNPGQNPVKVGVNETTRAYSLEDLFYKYGVDLQFYAHEHSYERLWPVYKDRTCNGTVAPYTNPPAPVHIVTGSAGDREGQVKFNKKVYPYSAFQSDDYGYTRLNIANATHIFLEQVSIDKKGAVIDKMTLIKDKSRHGAGFYSCHQGRKSEVYKGQPNILIK